ncbi:uncharacterized protein PITG_19063 [Phytophthora infestans T30-4]|uniref:Uncharacterized protein n=3 Tax=Phytophthora infestans TaxID=4787 RepID=D0NZZ6_PHYIT|nr:uncharacterized protein PITG_19063 [Phytophthora infestans T30-4]EEY70155.1 hypothetical protein PITG_19063 [Phytophthora infestans T30-4]|eukprot:XP_002997056.1 hypothetical protein PITG_19063 [Phytophthora infestans T30-4]
MTRRRLTKAFGTRRGSLQLRLWPQKPGGSCLPQSPKATFYVSSMFFSLSQKLSKGNTMAITIPTIIGVAYGTFAFFRYTGPDLGGAVAGEPKTTSAEWQAASVEYGKAQKANPIRHFKD